MKNKQTPKEIYKQLCELFAFEPTEDQKQFLILFSEFFIFKKPNQILLLKGYAGTGKTTLLCCITAFLKKINYKYMLLAPTGKAAKVMAAYTKNKAFTIHKAIYLPKEQNNGSVAFVKKENKKKDTLFFVDESSMISGGNTMQDFFKKENSLLGDLLDYISEGKNCNLIFMGDTAQLPPVKMEESPALQDNILSDFYHQETKSVTLKKVMRQHENSGILHNATHLRMAISEKLFHFQFDFRFSDVVLLENAVQIQNTLKLCFENISDTVVILRSNKRAQIYNQKIRKKIMNFTSEINEGDYLMAVKNNYFWVKSNAPMGFIANGDTFEIMEILKKEEKYEFSFAKVKIRFLDYPDQPLLETYLLLDSLHCEGANLPFEETSRLYQNIVKTYNGSKYYQMLKTKSNPYYNALQVKYAYALTCHKSQGGQWKNVFIEKPSLPQENQEYYRWLYTAITRAKKRLYLIGF